VFAVICILPIELYKAFVVSVLWNWFAVPVGASTMLIFGAWGLLLLVTLITGKYSTEKITWDFIKNSAIYSVVLTSIIWGMGAVLKLFM